MVVQLLDPSFWDQPHQETNKTLCSASHLHSRPAMVSSTNTKEEIEGKAGPTRGKPHSHWVSADALAAALPGAALERAAEDAAVGSQETAMTWNDQPIPSSLSASQRQ